MCYQQRIFWMNIDVNVWIQAQAIKGKGWNNYLEEATGGINRRGDLRFGVAFSSSLWWCYFFKCWGYGFWNDFDVFGHFYSELKHSHDFKHRRFVKQLPFREIIQNGHRFSHRSIFQVCNHVSFRYFCYPYQSFSFVSLYVSVFSPWMWVTNPSWCTSTMRNAKSCLEIRPFFKRDLCLTGSWWLVSSRMMHYSTFLDPNPPKKWNSRSCHSEFLEFDISFNKEIHNQLPTFLPLQIFRLVRNFAATKNRWPGTMHQTSGATWVWVQRQEIPDFGRWWSVYPRLVGL